MRNWALYNCDPEILAELRDWYRLIAHTRNPAVSWQYADVKLLMFKCPKLKARIAADGRSVTYAATVTKTPNDKKFIHIDHMPGVEARLLFPIQNTEGSATAFYSSTAPIREAPFEGSYKAYSFDEDTCTEIDRVELIQPIVIRITTPHAVICNSSAQPRVSLTLRLNIDPVDML
jgi:hypothetical protein